MLTLSVLLRARPTSRDELSRAATIPQQRWEDAVVELIDLGFLVVLGNGTVEVVMPGQPLADLIVHLMDQQASTSSDLTATIAQLPGLMREQSASTTAAPDTVPTEHVHGTRNQWDLWMRLMSEAPPVAPIAVFPDFVGLATVVLENEAMLREARAEIGFSLRTIMAAPEISDPMVRRQVTAMTDLGVELRTLPSVSGWFYVDPGVLAALPMTWGEAVPTSVALIREPALLAALEDYGTRLWSRSAPLPGVSAGWEPVLNLLAQGLSDGAVATALGLSIRTVRRRIADACEAYGTASRFALAAEWVRRKD